MHTLKPLGFRLATPPAAGSLYTMRPKRKRSCLCCKHPSSAVGSTQMDHEAQTSGKQDVKRQALRSEQRNSGTFRFWHDERRFKGSGTNCVVQSALFSQGGVRTGGYPKAAPVPGPLGWQRPTDWDLLWSPARVALQAAPGLQPGQLISAMPGLMSLTRKRKLGSTLEAALGATAWDLVPRTFTLPDQLPELKAHLAAQAALPNPAASPALTTCQPGSQPASLAEVDGEGPDGAKLEGVEGPGGAGVVPGLVGGLSRFWILKTAQHLGKGLVLLPEEQVYEEAKAGRQRSSSSAGTAQAAPAKPYVVAQRYVGNPLLIEGRKFGLRVWVLVTGQSPLRAYMHSNGLVLFSTHQYDAASWQGSGSAGVGLGHVTNYAQNMDGMVWDLGRLEQHLGAPAWALLWGRIQRSAALMVAAALKDMQANHAELQLPPESTFELLGLDYLVDTSMTPWLLEVNGTPSLAVDHEDAKVEQMIHIQKAGMVSDMFRLLGVSTRFKPRYDARRVAVRRARATAGTSASPANVDNGEGALAEGIVAEDRGDEEDFPCAIATAKAAEQLPAAQAREQPAAHAAMALKEVDTTPRPSKHLSPGVDSLCTKSDQLGVGPAARSRVSGHNMHSSPGSCSPARRLARRLVGRRRHRVICSPLQDAADTLQQGGKLDATQQQQQQQQQQGQQQQQAADPTSRLAATTPSASTATVVQPAGQQGASGKCVTHRSSAGPVQGLESHRGPVPRAAKAASGVASEDQQGASSCRAKLAGLPAHLVEALCPSSPSTLMARVAAELDNRGGFQPLMHLFPLPPSHSHTSSSSRLAATDTSQNGPAGRVMLVTATDAAATKEQGRAAAGRAQVGSAAAAGGGAATMWPKASPELVGSCASPRLVSVGRRRKVLLSPSSPPAARGMVTPPSGLGCEGRGVTHPLHQGCNHPQRANHERPDLPGQPDEQRRVNGHWQQKRLSSATDARVGRNAWDAIADVRATIHLPASAYTCTAGFEPRADGAGRGAEAMSADDRISGAAAASTIPWREPDMLLQGLLHSRCVVTP